MEQYQKDFANFLAVNDILYFKDDGELKDGRPTPYFVNIGKCNDAKLLQHLGSFYADRLQQVFSNNVNTIFGPSYKASSIAASTVISMLNKYGRNLKYEYDRKEAKTHGDASGTEKLMVTGGIEDFARIVIVDDVATSMATKYEALFNIEREVKNRGLSKVHISGFIVGVDRQQTTAVYKDPEDKSTIVLDVKGKDAIRDFQNRTSKPVYSIAGITDIIKYLYDNRIPVLQNGSDEPISNKTMDIFRKYMETYGV